MTKAIYDVTILSDLHKDARGYRPRKGFYDMWNAMTVEERNAEWTSLCDELDLAMEEDEHQKDAALQAYEGRIEELLALGATDRDQAKRWLVDSLELSDCGDPGYVCWTLGLRYTMETEFKGLVGGG